MSGVKILKKITVKDVAGAIKGNKDRMQALLNGDQLHLCDIYGVATSMKDDESPYGAFVRFRGQFKAVNAETGEIYRSGQLILPGVGQELLAGAINPEAKADIQFAFRVTARYDESSAVQYVYDIESLMEMAENDPVELLEHSLGKKIPLLVGATETAVTTQDEPIVLNDADNGKRSKKEKQTA